MKALDLTGKRFGKLVVVCRAGSGSQGIIWHVVCDCGIEKDVLGKNLTRGLTKSCGCTHLNDLTGKQFGVLTVVERAGSNWKVRCVCGIESIMQVSNLIRKDTSACSHVPKERKPKIKIPSGKPVGRHIKDEVGNVYGRLTVISRAYQNKKREWYWNCVCECGNETVVRGSHLRDGSVQSCYCLAHEKTLERTTTHGLTYTQEYKNIQGRKRTERENYLDTEWNAEKERFLRRLFDACVVCGITENEHKEKHGSSLQVDHVRPLSKGFGLRVGNATILCKDCNHFKHNTDVEDLPEYMRDRILLTADLFETLWNGSNFMNIHQDY